MARLGEILVQLGLISEDQLHEALSAQVVYGGRLGTNLVEIGHLTLDGLAKALARRHRMPAALAGHFDRCDAVIQQRVPSDVAGKWRVVPIGRLAHDSRRVAVAVRDPLPEHGRGELAFHLDVEPSEVVQAVAPELRIHYHLELAYQIPRANRFLRVKSRVQTELPVPPAAVDDTDIGGWRFQKGATGAGGLVRQSPPAEGPPADARPPEPPSARPIPPPPGAAVAPGPATGPQASTPSGSSSTAKAAAAVARAAAVAAEAGARKAAIEAARVAAAGQAMVDQAAEQAAAAIADEPIEVSVGSDPALRLDYQNQPLVPPVNRSLERERRSFVPSLGEASGTQTLARIAVRQVASSDSAIRAIRELPARPNGLEELARTVRRSETRDTVGELIVTSLGELPGAPLDAVAILVARPPLAIGWKGFCEEGPIAIESLAVPLDQPGLIADTYAAGRARLVEVEPSNVSVVDERMWAMLGTRRPNRVLVAPIMVVDKVICVLYVQTRTALGPAEAMVMTLAEAASTAFARLLRAAQR